MSESSFVQGYYATSSFLSRRSLRDYLGAITQNRARGFRRTSARSGTSPTQHTATSRPGNQILGLLFLHYKFTQVENSKFVLQNLIPALHEWLRRFGEDVLAESVLQVFPCWRFPENSMHSRVPLARRDAWRTGLCRPRQAPARITASSRISPRT